MKKLTTILLLVSFTHLGYSQCYPDRHNSTWFDGWISCDISPNPNALLDSSHWIMYGFDALYEMHELNIWNVNAPDLLDHGIKTAIIDYSIDGMTWKNYDTITIPQALGENEYEGVQLLDFEGVEARFLLITSLESYGSDCAGFAELKLAIDSVEVVVINDPVGGEGPGTPDPTDPIIDPDDPSDPTNPDNPTPADSICIAADVFPNPMVNDQLFITLKTQCVNAVHYNLTDATGRVLINNTPIALGETIEILDGMDLANGVYFIKLSSNFAATKYKVVKY